MPRTRLAHYGTDEVPSWCRGEVTVVTEEGGTVQARACRELRQLMITRSDMRTAGAAAIDQFQSASVRDRRR